MPEKKERKKNPQQLNAEYATSWATQRGVLDTGSFLL